MYAAEPPLSETSRASASRRATATIAVRRAAGAGRGRRNQRPAARSRAERRELALTRVPVVLERLHDVRIRVGSDFDLPRERMVEGKDQEEDEREQTGDRRDHH